MSSVVFILGAGASKACGGPLMADFLDSAQDLSRTGSLTSDRKAAFDRVFSAIGDLQAVHSKAQLDLTNIESVFTALELGKIIHAVPGLTQEEIPLTIAALKTVILTTLEHRILFPREGGHIHAPSPYDAFANLIGHLREDAFPKQTVSVITFNYDVAADLAMFQARMGPDYGIDPPDGRSNAVQLIKLHGSLNWALQTSDDTIRPLHFRDYFTRYQLPPFQEIATVMVPIGSQLQDFYSQLKIAVAPEPVLVPPSWNKADYHRTLTDVWSAAARHLSEAEYIFIIGYSLPVTDSFFRHLYALGTVGKSPLRGISVYNPEPSDGPVDTRFRELLGPGAISRYTYRPVLFEHAIHEIKDIFPPRK